MDKVIDSITQLIEELEEKIQMDTNNQTNFLFECTDIQSLDSSEEIHNYVNEVIREIVALKEKKNNMDKYDLNK